MESPELGVLLMAIPVITIYLCHFGLFYLFNLLFIKVNLATKNIHKLFAILSVEF